MFSPKTIEAARAQEWQRIKIKWQYNNSLGATNNTPRVWSLQHPNGGQNIQH